MRLETGTGFGSPKINQKSLIKVDKELWQKYVFFLKRDTNADKHWSFSSAEVE